LASTTTSPQWLTKGLHYALLVVLSLAAIGPFLWLLATALRGNQENIFATGASATLWPQHPTLQHFKTVWDSIPMADYFINSVMVSGLAVVFNVVFSVLAAYPLARFRFKGERLALGLIVSTMLVPFQVIMIPLYLLVLGMGFSVTGDGSPVASWLTLSVPFVVSGFGILFVKNALQQLPPDLEEAAVLDGCNSLQVLLHVLLPLLAPTLATLAVLTFMASWGDFLWPSIVLSNPKHFTLPLGLIQLQGAFSANWRLIAAGTILSMLPVLVFFVALQRYFIPETLGGSVKG
jgi:putative chitobiose transport system permease protein